MVWSDPMFAIITFPNPHTNHVSSVYLTHPEQVLVTARFAFASELRRRPVTATHARRRRQQRPGGGPIARAACLVVPLHARRADPFPLINSRPTPAPSSRRCESVRAKLRRPAPFLSIPPGRLFRAIFLGQPCHDMCRDDDDPEELALGGEAG